MVDGLEIALLPGMTVQHALLARYGAADGEIMVTDQWGNRVGLAGEVTDGMQLQTGRGSSRNNLPRSS